jgi:hypothetical protein
VLFLGGSTSARKYPQFVREELEKSVGPVTIYMLGFDWHSSLHTLYKIWTYADDIQPDLTIVLEGVNDFYRGFTPPDKSLPVYRSDYSHWSAALNPFWLRGRSRYDGRDVFYARPAGRFEVFETRDDSPLGWLREGLRESTLLRDMHIDFGGASEIPDGRIPPAPEEVLLRALPDYERNLRNIALSCQVKGLPVLFLTMPYTTAARQSLTGPGGVFTNDGIHNLSLEDFGRGMDRFNAAVLELRDEPRAFVLPLADELRAQVGEKQVFLDEVHLSAAGQLLEAQIVTRFIIEHELLKKPRN